MRWDIAFSRLINASSSATVQGRVDGRGGVGTVEGETRGWDSDDIFNPKKHGLDIFENENENN